MDFLFGVNILALFITFFVAGCLVAVLLMRAKQKESPLSLVRSSKNPIIGPGAYWWTKSAVLNPSAIVLGGRTHMVFRAIGSDGISRLGYADSSDGTTFEVFPEPMYEAPGVRPKDASMRRPVPGMTQGGTEDPRMVAIGGRVYITFNLYNGWDSIRAAVISISEEDFLAHDFSKWRGPHLMSRAGEINKNWILFPEKINGKYALLHNLHGTHEHEVRIAYVDDIESFTPGPDFVSPDPLKTETRAIAWHARMKSAGPPPLRTPEGWLVLYHALSEKDPTRYKLGAMVLDALNPIKIIARSPLPILTPEKNYENKGRTGMIYASGATIDGDTLRVYYGGGDRVICTASAALAPLLEALSAPSVHPPEIRYADLVKEERACPFDDPQARDRIAQNETAYLTYSIAGYHPDQLLVIPKRHLTRLEEMSEAEIRDCEALQKLGLELLKQLGHGGVNFLLREGDSTGKSVPHLHYNLIPDTRLGDMAAQGEERRQVMNEAEIAATVARLREALARLPL